MSEPDTLSVQKRPVGRLWAFWLLSCLGVPAVAGSFFGHSDDTAMAVFSLACLAGFIASIALAMGLGKRASWHPALTVTMAMVFMVGGFALVLAAMFTGCVTLGNPKFH